MYYNAMSFMGEISCYIKWRYYNMWYKLKIEFEEFVKSIH